jgi:hypothetical protein
MINEKGAKICHLCRQPIPLARLQALPAATTCIACSQTGRVAGFAVITGKTSYSELQLVSQETAQELYQKQDRKGSIATGVQFKNLPPPKQSNFDFEDERK